MNVNGSCCITMTNCDGYAGYGMINPAVLQPADHAAPPHCSTSTLSLYTALRHAVMTLSSVHMMTHHRAWPHIAPSCLLRGGCHGDGCSEWMQMASFSWLVCSSLQHCSEELQCRVSVGSVGGSALSHGAALVAGRGGPPSVDGVTAQCQDATIQR